MIQSSRQTVMLLSAYLVPNGFLGWEVEGVHLWKLGPQVVVELPELCVTPVHVPLVVQDADVHLRKSKKPSLSSQHKTVQASNQEIIGWLQRQSESRYTYTQGSKQQFGFHKKRIKNGKHTSSTLLCNRLFFFQSTNLSSSTCNA